MEFLDWLVYQNSLRVWFLAALTTAFVYAALTLLRRLVIRQLTALTTRTSNQLDNVVAQALLRTKLFFLLFVSLYAGSRVLTLPASMEWPVRVVGVLVMVLQVALWGNVIISSLIQQQMARRIQDDAATATTINALGFIARLAFYTVIVLLGLDNLDFDVTALIAGLGIGGIAVALALQNVLGDLFASLSIVLDRPFVIGDFIIVDDLMGTVEYVGLKTTRVRSLSGEQLIFANSDLLSARIRNYKRMFQRRIVFTIGVTYQTPRAQLEQIPQMIRSAIDAQPRTRFERCHFAHYGAFSLDFETVYHVLEPDYNVYMDVQQAINLDIHRAFEDAGIEFAYPTQTVFMAPT